MANLTVNEIDRPRGPSMSADIRGHELTLAGLLSGGPDDRDILTEPCLARLSLGSERLDSRELGARLSPRVPVASLGAVLDAALDYLLASPEDSEAEIRFLL